MISVNGQFPGPVLVFNENECAQITVVNQLNNWWDTNTTVHFHGQYFHGANWADGVPGVTQCLIPLENTMNYYFVPSPSGTSWYHGHYAMQYTSGLFGPYIVQPMQPSPYMTEKINRDWIAMLSDGYANTAQVLLNFLLSPQDYSGEEPLPDYLLINGYQDRQVAFDANRGDRILLRLINTAALTLYKFSIDGVVLQVVELDGNPVEPFPVSEVTIHVSQRVSVIIDLTLNDVSKFNALWMRFDNSLMPTERLYRQTTAALSFTGAATSQYFYGRTMRSSDIPAYNEALILPDTFAGALVNHPATSDMNILDAVPVFPVAAPQPTFELLLTLSFAFGADGVEYSYFNGITYNQVAHHNQYPQLYAMQDSAASGAMDLPIYFMNASFSNHAIVPGEDSFLYNIPGGAVVDIIVNNTDTGSHPIHFHGHRFWMVDSSENTNASHKSSYLLRDVAAVAPLGWIRFRFVADNPGSWILHCHIDWHMEEGLATLINVDPLSFIRNPNLAPLDHQQICSWWQQQEINAFNAAVTANSYTPTSSNEITAGEAAVGTFIANTIICVESVFALGIYKMGIMYSILFDLVALNVGTLLGVCWIELEHELWTKVAAGTLRYEIVAFLLCAGGMLPYIFEKFIKRGKVNKFAWLKHTQQVAQPQAASAPPVVGKESHDAVRGGTDLETDTKEAANRVFNPNGPASNAVLPEVKPAAHLQLPLAADHNKRLSTSISRTIVFHLAGRWEDDQNEENDHKFAPSPSQDQTHHKKHSSSQATLKDVQIEMNNMPVLMEGEERETNTHRPITTSLPASRSKIADGPASPSLNGGANSAAEVQLSSLALDKASTRDARNGDGVILDPTKHGEYKMAKAATQEMDFVLIMVMLAGDMLHNFVDGSIIASAFLTSNAIGLATSLGIFLEELPHLIGTFAVFVHAGAPVWKAVALSVFGALPFLIGGTLIIGVASDPSVDRAQISYLLAFAIGSFLYITLADLVPVLTSQWNGPKRAIIQTICVLIGMGIQAGIAVYNTHEGEDAHQFALPGGRVFDPT